MLHSDAGTVLTRCTDSLAQGRQLDAVGQFDGLGKTAIPTIQLRNRTGISSRPPKIGSASHIADCYFCF